MAKKTLTQATYAVNNIRLLPDQVQDQPTALKTSFDQTGDDNKEFINTINIPELQSETLNASGAHAIGLGLAEWPSSNNVGDALVAVKTAIDDVVAAGIVDGSVTDVKLSNNPGQIKERVSDNTTDIGTNTGNIGTNASNIGANTGDISTNASNIGTNTTDISTNAGNISTNTGNIATNTSGISDLVSGTTPAGDANKVSEFGIGVQKVSTEVDINNYTAPGTFVSPGAGLLNLPDGWNPNTRHVIIVGGGINFRTQIISSDDSLGNKHAIRLFNSSSYYPWRRLAVDAGWEEISIPSVNWSATGSGILDYPAFVQITDANSISGDVIEFEVGYGGFAASGDVSVAENAGMANFAYTGATGFITFLAEVVPSDVIRVKYRVLK